MLLLNQIALKKNEMVKHWYKNTAWLFMTKNRRSAYIPGKFLHLVLNVSPTGDMAIIMCKLLEHLLMKYCQILSREGEIPKAVASDRT